MKFFILPLLAALQNDNNKLNDDTWKAGMEVTYNMTYNSKGTLPDIPLVRDGTLPKATFTNFTAQIKCQLEPNQPEHMQCRMFDSEITETLVAVNETTTETMNKKIFPLMVEIYEQHFVFEIKFDKSGIAELIMASELETNFDEIRTLVYPFHTGVDIDTGTRGSYEAKDKFWTGNCDTKYEVMMVQEVIGKPDPVENGKWETGKSIIIDKKRDMDKCRSRVNKFIPPSMKSWAQADGNTAMELKSSESRIVADNTKFISITKFNGTVYPLISDVTKFLNVAEEIKLEYISVAPVIEKFSNINNPKSIGLMLGDTLNREST